MLKRRTAPPEAIAEVSMALDRVWAAVDTEMHFFLEEHRVEVHKFLTEAANRPAPNLDERLGKLRGAARDRVAIAHQGGWSGPLP